MNELCFRRKGGKSYIPNDAEKLSLELSQVQHRKGESAFRIQQCNVQETKGGLHLDMLYMALNRGLQLELSNK